MLCNRQLTVFLMAMLVIGLQWQASAKSTDSAEEDESIKQLRRSEISKALGLLKKHSVVGKNAKIVLKASGKHLLVDPSERLQVVSSHGSANLKTHKVAASSSKASKLTDGKQKAKSSGKPSTKKRASGRASKESSEKKPPQRTTSTTPLPSPLSSLSAIQKNIMDSASSNSATVVDSLMGSTLLDEITRLVTSIVRNKRASSLAQLSDLITETLDEQFGPHWHTVSVATAAQQPVSRGSNEILASTSKEAQVQLNSLTHVAIDDHRKTATFYVTYDFGKTLRIYIFK